MPIPFYAIPLELVIQMCQGIAGAIPVIGGICAPAITWVRDAEQTIPVEEETGRFWIIHGVEAVS